MRAYRALLLATLGLAFVVVVVGAYVRLSDAGLGCPDWPLCYGHPIPEAASDASAHGKAWKEMGHRYLAGSLGILILGIAVASWRLRAHAGLASALVALVVFQATLGKWTVTMLLKPAIVTAHLLGGMATLAVLLWLVLSAREFQPAPEARRARLAAGLALAVVLTQIALGGWVSANYAALACPDLPGCLGQALPPMDFGNAFHVVRDLGRTSEGALLSIEALTAIHWTHRMFSLVVLMTVGFAAFRAWQISALAPLAAVVAAILAIQFLLGLANVMFGLPLPLAAAHNAGAALLLSSLVVINFFSFRGLRPSW